MLNAAGSARGRGAPGRGGGGGRGSGGGMECTMYMYTKTLQGPGGLARRDTGGCCNSLPFGLSHCSPTCSAGVKMQSAEFRVQSAGESVECRVQRRVQSSECR